MKTVNGNRRENGIGLIEILIVLVVLVIGWAAIAALQGTLMSGSSVSKARNEALELAREKTEEMRNAIEKGQYVSDLATTNGTNDPDGTITGVNATFTRSWVLDSVDVNGDGVKEDYLKQLSMKVAWTDSNGVTEDVVLNSMIAFSSAANMASLATGGSGDSGETAAPGSYSATEGPVRPGITINEGTEDEVGNASNGSEDIYTSTDADGNLVVYTGTNTAENVNLTVFGGKILKFAGMIYYDSPAPFVRATSPSYCTTFTRSKGDCGINNSSNTNCAKYVCYAGGDCSNGGDGCCPNGGDVCPEVLNLLPKNLNGGWYGKIGDFFPTLTNAQQFPTICMGDSIDVPARFYVTKRISPGSTTGYEREGINTSFECMDNLISAANDSACENLINELTSYGISVNPNANPNEIADYEMLRPLASGAVNVVLAATNNSYYNGVFDNFCGAGTPGSSSGSSSGGSDYTHTCSCNYRNSTRGIESVTGTSVDGTNEIGCCSLEACEAAIPTGIDNNSTFAITCSLP